MNVSQALAERAEPKERQDVRALIRRYEPEIEKALPAAIGVERFTRIVFTELGRNPALYECSQQSLVAACLLSAQLGLEPGPLGHVYLVPFKDKGRPVVQFVIGYKGMVALAYRSGEIKSVKAAMVYENEPWTYKETDAGTRFSHTPLPPDERGAERLSWARGITRGGGSVVSPSWPSDWEAAKRQSPAGRKGSGPWVTHETEMRLKTNMRRLWPWLPTSATLARSFGVDEQVIPPEAIEAESVEEVLTEEVEA